LVDKRFRRIFTLRNFRGEKEFSIERETDFLALLKKKHKKLNKE